jgi:hypothetical protein
MATPDSAGGTTPVDFLQAAWTTPEPHEIFRDEHLGILIVPDVKPFVVEGQVLVVARQESWRAMTPLLIARFYLAGELVCEELEAAYNPERKSSLQRFGNDAGTPHLICFPRNDVADGSSAYDKSRPKATDEQLARTQARMQEQFRMSDFAGRLHRELGSIARR